MFTTAKVFYGTNNQGLQTLYSLRSAALAELDILDRKLSNSRDDIERTALDNAVARQWSLIDDINAKIHSF